MEATKSEQKFWDPIIERSLSVRALNCCKSIGVENLPQLVEYAKSNDLYHIRNCGRKTILELQDAINSYKPNALNEFSVQEEIISKHLSLFIEKIFDDNVLSYTEEVQGLFLSVFPNAKTFYSQCLFNYSSVFIALPNTVSIEAVLKCWQLGYDIINKTSQLVLGNRIYKPNLFEINLFKCLNFMNEHLNDAKTEFLFSRLPVPLTKILHDKFIQIKKQLPARAQNVLEREQITANTIIQFCHKLEDYGNVRFCGKQTASDIIIAYDFFYKDLVQLVNSSPERCNELIIQAQCSFLEDEDAKDVNKFCEERGHLPFFKLVYLYFVRSKDRRDIIYNKANGITNPRQTLAEIASEFDMSRERIRQITSHYLPSPELYSLMTLFDNQYSFFNIDFIDPAEVYPDILDTEFMHSEKFSEVSFVSILLLFRKFKSLNCGDKTLIINTEIFNSFDFEASIKDMSKTFLSKATNKITLPISVFVNNYILNDTFNYQKVENILVYIVCRIFGVEIDSNKNIILKQNTIDVEDEFYKILDSIGTPLPFDELCTRLISLHPTISYAPGTLKSFLFNSDRISVIGKTSTYALRKWNISNLTIRGLIHQILEQCDTPLSLDDIVEFLAIKGRKTNKRSINSNIMLDEKYDFVKFEGGLIGINSKNYGKSYIPIDRSSITRKSFDERVIDFLNYIDINHHIPFASSDDEEASLNRWYKNVIKGSLDVTEEQKELLEAELTKRKEFIMTSSEFAFIEKCKDMKYFVSSKFELPTTKTDAQLFNWFSKVRKKSFKFTPLKEKAYEDLIQFLLHYGFYIED